MQYSFALTVSRWHGRLTAALGGNALLTEAVMRDHWLRELTFHGAFPIPWRLQGRAVLDEYAVPGPVLYYNTHLPLVEIPLRVMMELNYPMPVPVVDPGRIVGRDEYVIAGMGPRIPAVSANSLVLARMRTLLMRGQSVVCLADNEFGGELLMNPLRLAGRLQIPVIFGWAELAEDDVLDVTFCPAPHPLCENEDAIAANLQMLRDIRSQVLHRLGIATPQSDKLPQLSARESRVRRQIHDTAAAERHTAGPS